MDWEKDVRGLYAFELGYTSGQVACAHPWRTI